MTAINKLRNSLIRKIQRLSPDKLNEIDDILIKKDTSTSKEKTLKLSGSWKDLDESLFMDLTEKLHQNRAIDREIE